MSRRDSARRLVLLLALAALLVPACASDDAPTQTLGGDAAHPLVLDLAKRADRAALPVLEPAISADETRRLRDAFSWATSRVLPERDAAGHPNLFYALVYLEHRDELTTLEELGIHHSFVPLFEEERTRWAGQAGFFTLEGDREGVFVFTIMPGVFINRLRDIALAGTPPFRAVVVREPPVPAARNADGAVAYDYLIANSFVYGGETSGSGGRGEDGARREPVITEILRAAVSPLEDAVDEARVFIGELDRLAAGSAKIRVTVRPMSTDPAFGTGPIRRGWGAPTRTWRGSPNPHEPVVGELLWLRNMTVQSHKGVSLFRGRANDYGVAEFDVAKGRQNLCVELSNPASEISNFLTGLVLCNFNDPAHPDENLDFQADTYVRMDVMDYRVNIFAQMQDSHDYMRWVAGRPPRQARVLVGFLADIVGELNGGAAFALCGGEPFTFYGPILDGVLGPVATLTPIGGSDIIFPFDRSPAVISRGVPTHEYGHFALCDLMHATNALKAQEDWINVVINSLLAAGNPAASNDTVYVNEAWADFFALQVVGGTNYAPLNGSTTATRMSYCPTTGASVQDCGEDNVGGPTGPATCTATDNDCNFDRNLNRIVTIFQDAFDGIRTERPPTDRLTPTAGAAWPFDARDLGAATVPSTDGRDEEIQLPGTAIVRFVQVLFDHYSTHNQHNTLATLARVMNEAGYSAEQVCELFALHSETGDCRTLVDRDVVDFGSIPPSTPRNLVSARLPGPSAVLAWRDISPIATGYDYSLTAPGQPDRTAMLPYRRSLNRLEMALAPDTTYTWSVATRNESLVSAPATAEFTTAAAAPRTVTATAARGAVDIAWTADTGTASAYEVWMTAPRLRLIARVDAGTRTQRADGLSDRETYTFGVAGVNRIGEATERVLSSPVTPLAPNVLYVHGTFGDDLAPGAGTATIPFRTITRALTEARARPVDEIRVNRGTYREPGALVITTNLRLVGGVLTGVDWVEAGESFAEVEISSLAPGLATPDTSRFTGGRTTSAAVTIASGMRATLTNMVIRLMGAAALPASSCTAVVHVNGGSLALDSVRLEMHRPLTAGSCAAGLMAVSAGAMRPSVDVQRSAVHGATSAMSATVPDGMQVAGIVTDDARAVTISDSFVFGLFGPWSAPALRTGTVAGVTSEGNTDVSVSRSDLETVEGTLAGAPGGTLVGAHFTATATIAIDNSVLRSANGGAVSRALDVGSAGTSLGLLSLVHVTAVAGTDWDIDGTVSVPFDGAAVAMSGTVTVARLINSVLSYAAGGVNTPGMRWTGLDLSRVTNAPAEITARGNVFSVPGFGLYLRAQGSFVYCHDDPLHEFGGVLTIEGLNLGGAWACDSWLTGAGPRWSVGSNVALFEPPISTATGTTTPWCVAFDTRGRPVPALTPALDGSEGPVRAAGVAFGALPIVIAPMPDRGGTLRVSRTPQGAGAWIL